MPAWWEAFEEEGSRRGRIFQNPPSCLNRAAGAAQMSVVGAPWAHGLVLRGGVHHGLASNSFSFFTGLCEKDSSSRLHLRSQPCVTIDCSAKGLE
jgi:hypothetical protein